MFGGLCDFFLDACGCLVDLCGCFVDFCGCLVDFCGCLGDVWWILDGCLGCLVIVWWVLGKSLVSVYKLFSDPWRNLVFPRHVNCSEL